MELAQHRNSAAFNPREKLALELVDAITAVPANVPDEMFARLQQEFSYPQIVELSAAVAFENYRARFNRVFDIQSAHFYRG